MKRRLSWLLLAMLWGAVACGKDTQERPPGLGNTGNPGQGVSVAGAPGEATGGDGDAMDYPEVQGRFRVFTDDSFDETENYTERSVVSVIDISGKELAKINYDGIFFETTEIPPSERLWMAVTPDLDESVFPTLAVHDTSDGEVVFPLVLRDSLDYILATLSTVVSVNSAGAQALLRLLDESGKPVSGVTAAPAGGGAVLYSDTGVWSEFASQTDGSGMLLIYNQSARDLPGETLLVALSGSVKTQVSLRIASGTATVAELVVE